MFRHILARNNWKIQYAAPALFSRVGRLLRAMPKTAIMYGKITGIYIEPNFTMIGVIVDEVFLSEKEPDHTLFVCAWQNP